MISIEAPALKGFRFPRSVIAYAVWAYHRFALSLRDVEDKLGAKFFRLSGEASFRWVSYALIAGASISSLPVFDQIFR